MQGKTKPKKYNLKDDFIPFCCHLNLFLDGGVSMRVKTSPVPIAELILDFVHLRN